MTIRRFETEILDPYQRGLELGRFSAPQITANLATYRELFTVVGVDRADLPGLGEEAIKQTAAWAPELMEELQGLADGSGRKLWELGWLNARTEILATVGAIGEGECSTVVLLPPDGPPLTMQTWDWHDVSNDDTLVVRYLARPGHGVRYFTEFGIVGKIGVNSAGIGVHFNILNHHQDGDGMGVPVHVVARTVLERATSLQEAIDLARSVSVSASTVLTIVSTATATAPATAVAVELSPAGAAVLPVAADGFLVHTNHFLDRDLALGDMVPPTSNSYPRLELLQARRDRFAAVDPRDRVAGLLLHEVDGAPVCCHPDPDLSFENRWQTLLTIALDVQAGSLQFHEGGPCTASPESWQIF